MINYHVDIFLLLIHTVTTILWEITCFHLTLDRRDSFNITPCIYFSLKVALKTKITNKYFFQREG